MASHVEKIAKRRVGQPSEIVWVRNEDVILGAIWADGLEWLTPENDCDKKRSGMRGDPAVSEKLPRNSMVRY